ncbi:methenyltetrahydrofolate cyclohydrolase [Acidobacteria bacterium Mor1]|nr:methenyltetrahydrofolate cyclohydrolase [Acidobacteria bacterium Mor1]
MQTESSARKLDGKATAKAIHQEVAKGCAELQENHGVRPGLTVVLVGEDPASQIYVRNKEKSATEVGMKSEALRLPADTSEAEILDTVRRLNDDPSVHGILVQLPLPEGVDSQKVIETIAPEKDVDGFHPYNTGRLLTGLPGLVSCTPFGIIELLKRYEVPMSGKHAVVIGRSNIVGKPLAVLLLRENCTVTICHSRTQDLPGIASSADILLAAIGRPAMITREYIKPGAVVVDVGIHRVEDEATCRELFGDNERRLRAVQKRGATLVGDVHPQHMLERASAYTPVPGGVGPLTIALLLQNTLQAARESVGAAS